ncbi:MAG: hypothetical protein P8046_14145 [Anaerolineales bacterium]
MQREIELAGISTITLSGIPDLTASVGVPRLAAIEHPLGYLLGKPGDKAGQLTVLTSTLQLLAEIKKPGSVVHLPFEWPESVNGLNAHPEEQPPIVNYLLRHPWHIPNLFKRNIPADAEAKPI